MLEVKIDKIIPVTEARDNFNKVVDEVESGDELYVLTKNGKPCAVIVGVHHLEKLTGTSHEVLMGATAAAIDESVNTEATNEDTATEPSAEIVDPIDTAQEDVQENTPAPINLTNFQDDGSAETYEPDPIIPTAAQNTVTSDAVAAEPTQTPTSSASDFTNVTETNYGGPTPVSETIATPTPTDDTQQTSSTQNNPLSNNSGGVFEDSQAQSEDPLDFLTNLETTQPEVPADNTAAAQPAEQPVINSDFSAFSDVSDGPNGANTPDDFVPAAANTAQGAPVAQNQPGEEDKPQQTQNIPIQQ